MSQKEKQRLGEDAFEDLFIGQEVTIGKAKATIEPLGFKMLAGLLRRLRGLGKELSEAGVTWDNYSTTSGIVPLASVIMDNCPAILSDATGIHQEDLERLPLEYHVELLSVVIEVNTRSKEVLEKNFESLAGKLSTIMNIKGLGQ